MWGDVMSVQVKFYDYSAEVKAAIESTALASLEEAAGELESAVKRNTRVDTGRTKNSWRHSVSGEDGKYEAQVGSDYENAIWEEFGTGQYAIKGDGRKGGWYYVDAKGEGHFTYGKRPSRAFQKAYDAMKNKIINMLKSRFKAGLK